MGSPMAKGGNNGKFDNGMIYGMYCQVGAGQSNFSPRQGFLTQITSPENNGTNSCLDAKWKQFSGNVERALGVWDSVEEWADYISFLGKLLKALRGGGSYNNIPNGPIVACRLSQCLQPGLPSGVHQKALEVYGTVFKMLGADQLYAELGVWLPGILPLMTYASISVKPTLISLYQEHVLTLPALPRHVIKPLILALLPGIDDESSESFDDVFKLLDDIKLKLNDDTHFWACFFLVIISSADRRLGALAWCNKRLPKFSVQDFAQLERAEERRSSGKTEYKTLARQSMSYEAQMATGPDPGLLIRAFCRGLEDEQPLVQRGFLEFLVKNLELQSVPLQMLADQSDLERLLVSVCSTVLRRDMSLNRRLWNWLLGPDPETGEKVSRDEYFAKYALEPLVKGILKMFEENVNEEYTTGDKTKPFKICLSILDRWEVGGSVVPRVLIPSIRAVKQYCDRHPADEEDVVRSASTFIDGVEAVHIWHDIVELILAGDLELTLFVLETFNVNEEEMVITHLPLALLVLFGQYEQVSGNGKMELWYSVCSIMLGFIPDRAFLPLEHSTPPQNIQELIKRAYSESPEDFQSPISAATLSELVLDKLAEFLSGELRKEESNYVVPLCDMLCEALAKVPHAIESWRHDGLVGALLQCTETSGVLTKTVPLFTTIVGGMDNKAEVDKLVAKTLKQLWEGLITHSAFSTSDDHVRLVRGIWLLHEMLMEKDPKRVESGLASLFVDEHYLDVDQARAFSALWYHSVDRTNCEDVLLRTLYLMIDKLCLDGEWPVLVSHWLDFVVSSKTTEALFTMLLQPITSTGFLEADVTKLSESDDIELFVYYVQSFSRVLKAHGGVKNAFFLHHETPKTLAQCLVKFLKFPTPMDESLASSHELGLDAVVDLLEVIVNEQKFVVSEEWLVELIEVLMALLRDPNNGMGQIGVLKLLTTCLERHVGGDKKVGLPKDLVQCIIDGLSQDWNEFITERWVNFLIDCLQLFDETLLQVLIPLVECFCSQITKAFENIKESNSTGTGNSESFFSYMNGVERLLVTAHHKLMMEEANMPSSPNPSASTTSFHGGNSGGTGNGSTQIPTMDQQHGFFGNVISGVFSVESPLARSTAANNRLTVLLCFQDTIKVCFEMWKWVISRSSSSSLTEKSPFLSSRLRSRTRKVMIKLYKLEALETLECLMERHREQPESEANVVFKIIHVLDGSRPKLTVPHLFESVTGRSNHPGAVEPVEKSTVATSLTIHQVMMFLVDYLRSLEHDAIEEIWHDCIGFIREVQNNQSLYKSILPLVLKFISVVAYKVDHVKFGEQRKIRKDLADLFTRLLSYTLTTRESSSDNSQDDSGNDELAITLREIVPGLRSILVDTDKVHTALTNMMMNMIVPVSKSKVFPKNMSSDILELLIAIMEFPQGHRSWRNIIGDIIFEQRFMNMSPSQAKQWMPVIKRWIGFDKERLKDYVNRLNTSNSVVLFGSSDETSVRKCNINRLAYIILGTDDFMFINIRDLSAKLEEMMTVSPDVLAEVFTCFRALVLRVDPQHLAPLWTLIYTHLLHTFQEVHNGQGEIKTVISACKLLDMLLCVGPEDFQLHEWLFICDNMDAIFRENKEAVGIIDKVSSEGVISTTPSIETVSHPPYSLINDTNQPLQIMNSSTTPEDKKRPILSGQSVKTLNDLKPFFDQLSIYAYEGIFSLKDPDLQTCKNDVLDDIFSK
ncbi:hypothetical protein TRICI_000012 [Trichomonascus ciferrii]|uniref:Uncharacterized protein n=1 Tax=Trichomonascus ciferrii TaxID=44093 RepID=A0A642VEK1_9ASCO|nr:hypothetical protein TRICI_000012 [Trichomonascus ciferrii]